MEEHDCNLSATEIAMIDGDEHGCKVMKCNKCNKEFDSHREIYGCKK